MFIQIWSPVHPQKILLGMNLGTKWSPKLYQAIPLSYFTQNQSRHAQKRTKNKFLELLYPSSNNVNHSALGSPELGLCGQTLGMNSGGNLCWWTLWKSSEKKLWEETLGMYFAMLGGKLLRQTVGTNSRDELPTLYILCTCFCHSHRWEYSVVMELKFT